MSNNTETKTVWIIAGNKGGVGKSLFCLALASALELRGSPFAVLDGDSRTSDVYNTFLRKCPAISADFRLLQPGSPHCSLDGPYETQATQLLKYSPHMIINTPDGADDTLLQWFDTTLQHLEVGNILFKMVFLMSDRPDGLGILPEMCKRFSFIYPVINLHFGQRELFTEFNEEYSFLFRRIVHFPILRKAEARLLSNLHTYPAEAIRLRDSNNNYTVQTLSRTRYMNWQLEFMEEFEKDLLDNTTTPNLKAAL